MTETRARLIQALRELGERFPDWRFGQLVENAAGWTDVAAWDVEDQQLLQAVEDCLNQQRASSQADILSESRP